MNDPDFINWLKPGFTGRVIMISFELPIKIISEANVKCHWAVKMKRVREQRGLVYSKLKSLLPECFDLKLDCLKRARVTLTRIASRELDTDNISSAFKACRDGVADAFSCDDSKRSGLQWEYKQEKSKRGDYRIRVEIFPLENVK